MSFRSTRSSGDDSVPIIDRIMGNLACGFVLDNEMAKFFDTPLADLQQLLLIKVSEMFLLGNAPGMNMSETFRHYNIEDDSKFQTIIVGEILRRNALTKNDVEYLGRKIIFDLYRTGFSMINRCKK